MILTQSLKIEGIYKRILLTGQPAAAGSEINNE